MLEPRVPRQRDRSHYFFLVVFLAVDFLVDFFAAAFFVAMVVITSFP